ncbi:MAG: hypothetical protein QOJ33_73, partial [Chloroflexota bacterium]|nr:hypothetical protein [Chloroflexota bacterium]
VEVTSGTVLDGTVLGFTMLGEFVQI